MLKKILQLFITATPENIELGRQLWRSAKLPLDSIENSTTLEPKDIQSAISHAIEENKPRHKFDYEREGNREQLIQALEKEERLEKRRKK